MSVGPVDAQAATDYQETADFLLQTGALPAVRHFHGDRHVLQRSLPLSTDHEHPVSRHDRPSPGLETLAPVGPILDKPYIAAFARAHEEAGFDRILVGYWSDQPDGFLVAAAAGPATSRIGLLLAHRPGFVAPTLAARKLATLEHLLDGRLAVHIISGGSDADQRKDGDYLDHDQRYARSDEFIELLKRTWTSTEPFDFHGAHYRVSTPSRPSVRRNRTFRYFGGSSEAALKVAGKQADVFMLWGEPWHRPPKPSPLCANRRASNGREVEFSLSFRPILGRTEDEAWAKAEAIRASAGARLGEAGFPKGKPQSVGASVCSRRWSRASASTSAFGPESPGWSVAGTTPPPWLVPRNRWPTLCSPTTTWACAISSFAVSIPRRCRGIWPRADPADPRQSRRARAPARHGLIPWPSCRLPRRRSMNGCQN